MKTKLTISILAVLLLPFLVQATHLHSGYISYTRDAQNPNKFNFVFTLYTNHYSVAEDPEVYMYMGDGNRINVVRSSVTRYSRTYDKEIFKWSYTYPNAGNYTVYWIGENLNANILNIPPPSDQISLNVYTTVKVDPLYKNMHSARLAGVPILSPRPGVPFSYNLLAYDADGDELIYDLVPPKYRRPDGAITYVPGYQFPDGLTVNRFGELRWKNPGTKGQYVIALEVTEKRDGQVMGSTLVYINLFVLDPEEQPEMVWLNKNRLTLNSDGSVIARPNQPLKLEYYLRKGINPALTLSTRQFSELDTLNLSPTSLAIRDTVDGYALTLRFTPTDALKRSQPYLIGLRGRSNVLPDYKYNYAIEDNWAFTYILVGEQQPASSEGDLAKAGFILYPNPATDKFMIEAPDMPDMHLQLRDATGKAIQVLLLKPGRNHFVKPPQLASGLYLYTISSRQKPVGTGRLVVR